MYFLHRYIKLLHYIRVITEKQNTYALCTLFKVPCRKKSIFLGNTRSTRTTSHTYTSHPYSTQTYVSSSIKVNEGNFPINGPSPVKTFEYVVAG